MDTLEQNGRPDGERLDLGRLDSLVGFHLRMATAALYRDFAQAMEGTGLTQKLFAVLELIEANPDLRPTLRRLGFLTRDPRVKERKKYGRKRARRGFQFSKR